MVKQQRGVGIKPPKIEEKKIIKEKTDEKKPRKKH